MQQVSSPTQGPVAKQVYLLCFSLAIITLTLCSDFQCALQVQPIPEPKTVSIFPYNNKQFMYSRFFSFEIFELSHMTCYRCQDACHHLHHPHHLHSHQAGKSHLITSSSLKT